MSKKKKNKKLELMPTQRGFMIGEFLDVYENRCSIQESSAVQPQIWLGVDEISPKFNNITLSRMLLNRKMAKALIPHLKRFVKTGHL